jgi:hypothetical protein
MTTTKTTRGTDEMAKTAAEQTGAKISGLWAPWNDPEALAATDVSALLAKPHRVLIVDRVVQIWARGNAHVIEIRPA